MGLARARVVLHETGREKRNRVGDGGGEIWVLCACINPGQTRPGFHRNDMGLFLGHPHQHSSVRRSRTHKHYLQTHAKPHMGLCCCRFFFSGGLISTRGV